MLKPNEITECVLQHRRALTSYIQTVTRNYHLAEDVYQEICVKVIHREDQFSSNEHVLRWFRVAARNRAIDIIRTKEGRYVGLSEETLTTLAQDWGHAEPPKLAALADCVQLLTPRSRQILKMRYAENRSGSEVAEYMGCKIDSAYQAVSRIHKTLMNCITQRMEVSE